MSEMHLRQPGFTYSACGTFKNQNKNTKIQRNRRLQVFLSESSRQGLLPA